MAIINYFGFTANVFEDAFADIELVSYTSTQLVVAEKSTGIVTTLTGFGFAPDASAESDFAGTVTGFEIATGSNVIATFSDILWTVDEFDAAIQASVDGDDDILNQLLSRGPVLVDASSSNLPIDFSLDGVTSKITFIGSQYGDTIDGGLNDDTLLGGDGDDDINPGDNPSSYDVVDPDRGNDTVTFEDIENGYVDLLHNGLDGPFTVDIDGNANTGTIDKGAGNGTTTLIDVSAAMWADGLNVGGTDADDTFNVTVANGGWMSVLAGRGNDTFNLGNSSGTLRIDLRNDSDFTPAEQGIQADLGLGMVFNDGFGGQDTINGVGNVTVELRGCDLSDSLVGSTFDDRFITRGGNDTVDGGDGFDTVRYNRSSMSSGIDIDLAAGTASGSWNGTAFTDTLISVERILGSHLSDDILGSDADERFEGQSGNDTLFGGGGDDTILGGTGNDYLNPGDNDHGYDIIDAHTGNDTVDFADAQDGFFEVMHYDVATRSAFTVNVDGNANTGSIYKGAGNGLTTLLNVSRAMNADGLGLIGSDFDDIFNVTVADGGWVSLRAGQGNDTFNLGASTGTLRLELQADAHYNPATQGAYVDLAAGQILNDGFGGQDVISGVGNVRLQIHGTDFADTFIGSDGNEHFLTRGGDDTVEAGAGFDTVRYDRNGMTSGVQVDLQAGTATGSWNGTAFTDTLSGVESVRGSTAGASTLLGDAGDNLLTAGGSQNHYLDGRDGDDMLETGDGQDTLLGGDGNDEIRGFGGNDFIGGGAGNDTIDGGNNSDTIYGGLGDDLLQGGYGADLIYGSAGNNTITTSSAEHGIVNGGTDTVVGGEGDDTVYGGWSEATQIFGNGGNDVINGSVGTDFIGGGEGNDTLLGNGGNDTIYLGLGDDLAGGGDGNDLIFGGAGSNAIYGGLGNDTVQGGSGADYIAGGGSGQNILLGNDGSDTIQAGSGADLLAGGAGNDFVYGGDGNNTIYLGLGDDFTGGGAGNDLIVAGAGTNRIYGGTGDDTIVSGTGRDVITAGPGADVFVFTSAAAAGIGAGRDVITDFELGVDKIDLSALGLSFAAGGFTASGGGEVGYIPGFVVGDVDGDGSNDFAIEISGAPALTVDDFIL
ncbi:hypothetical protein JYP51_20035 [Ponticoccus gilvus]|nr:hypothetical protein [Enemella evansiae]